MSKSKTNAIKKTITTVVSYRRKLAEYMVQHGAGNEDVFAEKTDKSTIQFILALVLFRWVSVKQSHLNGDPQQPFHPESLVEMIDSLKRFHQPGNSCFELLNDFTDSLSFIGKYGPGDVSFWNELLELRFLNDKGHPLQEEYFGRIYEELRKEALVLNDGMPSFQTNVDRRDNGKFYTPADVTEAMVNDVLEKWLESSLGKKLPGNALRVLDPTVGAGAFLIQMARALHSSRLFSGSNEDSDLVRKQIVEKCLFGIDLDTEALSVCKMSLWLWVQPCSAPVLIQNQFIHRNILTNQAVWHKYLGKERFHLIVGNPPYVKVVKSSDDIKKATSIGLETTSVQNLYAYVYEISLRFFLHDKGIQSLIIPLDVTCGRNARTLREVLLGSKGTLWFHNFDSVPGYVFNQGKVEQHGDGKSITQRTTIVVCDRASETSGIYSTELLRWKTEERDLVFPKHQRALIRIHPSWDCRKGVPKIGSNDEMRIFKALHSQRCDFIRDLCQPSNVEGVPSLRIPTAVRYFIHAHRQDPEFVRAGATLNPQLSRSMELLYIYINSHLFYWYWRVMGNGFQLTKGGIEKTPIPKVESSDRSKVNELYSKLSAVEASCRVVKRNANKDIINFNFNLRHDVLTEIDEFFLTRLNLPVSFSDYVLFSKSNSIHRDRKSLEKQKWYQHALLMSR